MSKLVKDNKGYQVFWNCNEQRYEVYKDGKWIINGHLWDEVRNYVL